MLLRILHFNLSLVK